jgi:hypothetical protein
MGHLVTFLCAIGGILASALSNQIADEFKAWTPWLTNRLIALSASRLPKRLKERYKEEWSRHVEDTPGQVGKIAVAAGFLKASHTIRSSHIKDSTSALQRLHYPPILPGTIIGHRIGGDPPNEADHFYTCQDCGRAVDMRDLGQVFHHETPTHEPLPPLQSPPWTRNNS